MEVGDLAKWQRCLTPRALAVALVDAVKRATGARRVAILYCSMDGPYIGMDGVDCWPVLAQHYGGPWPVVAHPPCGPWGRFRWKCTRQDREPGLAAMEAVHKWRGVIEHPWRTTLFTLHGRPGGVVQTVDQCLWGHPCRKRTDLYWVL